MPSYFLPFSNTEVAPGQRQRVLGVSAWPHAHPLPKQASARGLFSSPQRLFPRVCGQTRPPALAARKMSFCHGILQKDYTNAHLIRRICLGEFGLKVGKVYIPDSSGGSSPRVTSGQLTGNEAMWIKMMWRQKNRKQSCFKHESQIKALGPEWTLQKPGVGNRAPGTIRELLRVGQGEQAGGGEVLRNAGGRWCVCVCARVHDTIPDLTDL